MRSIKMKNMSGFSLMEMMVTIAIIAILAAIVVPNVVSWRNNSQFNAAVREVKNTVEGARMEAIKSNLTANLVFNGTNTFTFQNREFSGGAVILKPIVTHRLAPGVTANLAGGPLTFNNRGMIAATATITIQHTNGLSNQIVVDVTGNSVIQ